MKRFRFWRKLLGGIWYQHEFTEAAEQITMPEGVRFWSRYDSLSRYTKVIKTENFY